MSVSTKKNSLKSKTKSKTRKQLRGLEKVGHKTRKMNGGNMEEIENLSKLFFTNEDFTIIKRGHPENNTNWIKYIKRSEQYSGIKYEFSDLFTKIINSHNNRKQYLLYVMCRFSNFNVITTILNEQTIKLELNSKSFPDDSHPAIGCAFSTILTLDEKIQILKLIKNRGGDISVMNKNGEDIFTFLINSIKMELSS